MSAYGHVASPSAGQEPLAPRVFALPASSPSSLAVIHLNRHTVPLPVTEYLRSLFNATVRDGRTYPQEFELSAEAFDAYYLSADLFVGVLVPRHPQLNSDSSTSIELPSTTTLESLMNGRSAEESIGGMYYVKPNYPGRSSHCCNAGFIVAHAQRGLRLGTALGRSYLHYAPRLGYRASVFNLVYGASLYPVHELTHIANNAASLAIWDKLGFQRAGLIPRAGRLRTADGQGEEYVDAIVYHRSFNVVQ